MNSGSYQIHINVSKNIALTVGKLGKFTIYKGYYIYTGSAMRNLEQRVARHKRKNKILKWHIDYLLASRYCKIIRIDIFPSEVREECIRNMELIDLPNTYIPIKGFGSSDCSNCPSHLVGFF